MELIKEIGGYLGLAAFLALAVLVMLYFQQARDVRRLREWAGRAPERAAAAAEEAAAAAAEEAGVGPEEEPSGGRLSRLSGIGGRSERFPQARYLIAILGVVVIAAAGVVTSGFGLLGDEGGGGKKAAKKAAEIKPSSITVSVLNATGVAGAPGVPGLAEKVAKQVKKDGYKLGAVTDAGTANALTSSLVMYKGKNDRDAAGQVSDDLRKTLGKTKLLEMTPEVEPQTDGAPVAVVIGTDDSDI